MGLDTVELVMAVESTFGVDIRDAEAERMQTVGDVERWLRAALLRPFCATQRAFHEVRRELRTFRGVARADVRPAAPLLALLPDRGLPARWRATFADLEAGRRAPPLRRGRPGAIGGLIALTGIGLAVAAISADRRWLAVSATTALAGAGVAGVTALRRSPPPADVVTVGDLARRIAASRRGPVDGRWTEATIWAHLVDVVAEQTGVARGRIRREHAFVGDYGMG